MVMFWKPTEAKSLLEQSFEPLGNIIDVGDKLLSIPSLKPYLDLNPINGYTTISWEKMNHNLLISYKNEPEFGSLNVFSLQIDKILFEKEFFKLYVQIFEALGCSLLYEKKFLTPKEFKKLI